MGSCLSGSILVKRTLRRARNSHKGDFGHAIIVAGSPGMAGAAFLSAKAALMSGAGKVTLATQPSVYSIIGTALPECLHIPVHWNRSWKTDVRKLQKVAEGAQALGIGPGWGRQANHRTVVKDLLEHVRVPLLMDADALWALRGQLSILKKATHPVILTPHDGEFRYLFGANKLREIMGRKAVAKELSNQYHCILVRKGPGTLVASPHLREDLYQNKTGNPGMASGGVGDVLLGLITGLAAQGFKPFAAARLGVFIHGRAGDLARRQVGESALTATDILQHIPAVLKELEKQGSLPSTLIG